MVQSGDNTGQVQLVSVARTHAGLRREHNEDAYIDAPAQNLWVVADGVGGHAHGEVASRLACDTIHDRVAAGDTLEQAVLAAHDAVLAEIARNPPSEDDGAMGTTVVALRMQGARYELSWVGDSRAYLWNGRLKLLTRDHSRVNQLLARGQISLEETINHPQRHVLTQSIGISEDQYLRPGKTTGELQPGESLLLCSDGLTDELYDRQMTQVMARSTDPKHHADDLLQAALKSGGRDNITLVIVAERSEAIASGKRWRLFWAGVAVALAVLAGFLLV